MLIPECHNINNGLFTVKNHYNMLFKQVLPVLGTDPLVSRLEWINADKQHIFSCFSGDPLLVGRVGRVGRDSSVKISEGDVQ